MFTKYYAMSQNGGRNMGTANIYKEIAERTGRTRNEIIQMCLEFSMENIEID